MVKNNQHTIRFHIDHMLLSHLYPKVNDEFWTWSNKKYDQLKPVTLHRGKKNDFLGMELDFSKKGECHVRQKRHIKYLITSWPDLEDGKSNTPSYNELFKRGKRKLLSEEK